MQKTKIFRYIIASLIAVSLLLFGEAITYITLDTLYRENLIGFLFMQGYYSTTYCSLFIIVSLLLVGAMVALTVLMFRKSTTDPKLLYILSACFASFSFVIALIQLVDLALFRTDSNWGPVVQPYGDKALISYYVPKPGVLYGQEQITHKIAEKSGRFALDKNQLTYEIPSRVNRLLLVTDVHCNRETI